ncbi:NAPDH-dependent diflavin reductase [Malassezia nana]|uniref:NAPDH-dependent diflavin reductase n=1 Tax=Malassezia nana TaxID=180528 RepID=A0AAF0EKQ8_9BASI|nr:NAPDH-dependent diflavin reductase [Malassezia nana]
MSSGAEHQEQPTSPLSSEAETEPLPFDETENDTVPTQMDATAQPLAVEQEEKEVMNQPPPQAEEFGAESDLSEEPDAEPNRAEPDRAVQDFRDLDDESSLSEAMDEEREGPMENSRLELSALDGLAELAASSSNVQDTAPAATSSTLSSDTSRDEDQVPAEHTTPPPGDEDGDMTMVPMTPSSRNKTSLHRAAIAAFGKRRAAATGGAPSLLVDQDGESSAPGSTATSRQGSPVAESETGETKDVDMDAKVEDDAESEAPEPKLDDKDEEVADTQSNAEEGALENQARGGEQGDEDDEASQQRQEAMELLTRLELGFAMLRERLYRERLEELEREADLIQQGTHPELRLLHTLIDTRKERRLTHLDVWLEKSEQEHELRARAEDKIAWLNWRDKAASLRRQMLAQTDRERRKLEHEKRMLDAPPPMRRHQPFEVEFVRKPPSYSRRTRRMGHLYMTRDMAPHDTRGFLAYPDVRGLDEYDTWMDLDQMGIRSALPPPPPGMLPPSYARPEDVPPHDMYAPYPPMPGDAPMGYYGPPGPAPRPGMGPVYDGMYVDRMEMPSRKMSVGYEKGYGPPMPVQHYGEAPVDMHVMHA